MRIAMGVEYNGAGFCGWQAQKHGVRTVQETLELAIAKVAAHPLLVVCAGRTDTGVHGLGQVIHFDTQAQRSERGWMLGCNAHLPDEISVTWARVVDDQFHARFSALSRRYRYLILNRSARSALLGGRASWIHRPLDEQRMHQAGQCLIGTHDFSSYRAQGCQAKSPIRTLHGLAIHRQGDLIELRVHANAFLHHMVRNIAGVLISIGQGDWPMEWAREVLDLRNRTLGGVTAPPDGLYFERVHYPPEFELPTPSLAGFPLSCRGRE